MGDSDLICLKSFQKLPMVQSTLPRFADKHIQHPKRFRIHNKPNDNGTILLYHERLLSLQIT